MHVACMQLHASIMHACCTHVNACMQCLNVACIITAVDHVLHVCACVHFLNQACAGCRPARAWFLKIVSVQMSVCVCVCVFVCLPPKLLITSGMKWRDVDPI